MIVEKCNQAVLANPFALKLSHFDSPHEKILAPLRNSAHHAITEKDLVVLKSFYEQTKLQSTKLGLLYQSLSFNQFIERLITKRYDKAYLDGRQIFGRQFTDHHDPLKRYMQNHIPEGSSPEYYRRNLLDMIGTQNDTYNIYTEYLSLAELSVSGLVLMITTDAVLGRGARGLWKTEDAQAAWYDESKRTAFFEEQSINSTFAAVFSYPAAIEFRSMASASFDTVYCVISDDEKDELWHRRSLVLTNPALGETLHGLYGGRSALSFTSFVEADTDRKTNDSDWYGFIKNGKKYLLYIPAYREKLSRLLTQIILAHDHSMAKLGLGKVLNIKGLSFGAFGLGLSHTPFFERILVETLQALHLELAPQIKYIRFINLINAPSLFSEADILPTLLRGISEIVNGVQLSANCMDPTARYIVTKDHVGFGTPEYEVGGVIFCGDSATSPGNEARVCSQKSNGMVCTVGSSPDSSDAPAQIYAMAQPTAFDSNANPVMCQQRVVLSTFGPHIEETPLAAPGISRESVLQLKESLGLSQQAKPAVLAVVTPPALFPLPKIVLQHPIESVIRFLLEALQRYQSQRLTEGEYSEHAWFPFFNVGYSKSQKINAVKCFIDLLNIGENPRQIDQHIDVLRQGRLGACIRSVAKSSFQAFLQNNPAELEIIRDLIRKDTVRALIQYIKNYRLQALANSQPSSQIQESSIA